MRGMSVAGTRGGYGQRPGLGGAAGQAGQPAGWSLLGKFSLHLLITALAGSGAARHRAARSRVTGLHLYTNSKHSTLPSVQSAHTGHWRCQRNIAFTLFRVQRWCLVLALAGAFFQYCENYSKIPCPCLPCTRQRPQVWDM